MVKSGVIDKKEEEGREEEVVDEHKERQVKGWPILVYHRDKLDDGKSHWNQITLHCGLCCSFFFVLTNKITLISRVLFTHSTHRLKSQNVCSCNLKGFSLVILFIKLILASSASVGAFLACALFRISSVLSAEGAIDFTGCCTRQCCLESALCLCVSRWSVPTLPSSWWFPVSPVSFQNPYLLIWGSLFSYALAENWSPKCHFSIRRPTAMMQL